MELLKFEPIYQERVWGGRGLESRLGRKLPSDSRIGESWEIVDRPEAQSIIATGSHRGKTLRQVIEEDPEALMGPGYDRNRPFPILVKWLDCQERLSLQVHPPTSIAGELGGEPKTENWYIAEAEHDAALLVGLKPGVTRQQFEAAINDNTLEELVGRIKVRSGDSMFVYSGRIHAIDAGNLILEIQQNSDTTYRVYDWGRTGLDGKPRQLHVEESLRSIDFSDSGAEVISPASGVQQLVSSDIFSLRKVPIGIKDHLSIKAGEQARILSVVEGAIRERGSNLEIRRSENVLLPYSGSFDFGPLDNQAVVLLTEDFI